jgi:hypothetical protein
LATTDAAAIAALRASPSITARCSTRHCGTLNPSVRQIAPGTATRSRLRASAARLVTCNPLQSIPRTQRTVTATLRAARTTTG